MYLGVIPCPYHASFVCFSVPSMHIFKWESLSQSLDFKSNSHIPRFHFSFKKYKRKAKFWKIDFITLFGLYPQSTHEQYGEVRSVHVLLGARLLFLSWLEHTDNGIGQIC